MIYLETLLVLVALVFSICGLIGVPSKINWFGWAVTLVCVALLLGHAPLLVVR